MVKATKFMLDLKSWKSPDEDAKVSPEVNVIKEDKHIKYFKLPEDNGWNNGRALLISQGTFHQSQGSLAPSQHILVRHDLRLTSH